MKNKNSIKIIFASIFFLIITIDIQGQDSVILKNLSERLTMLETYKKEILDAKFDAKSIELTNKIDFEINKAKDDVNNKLWILLIGGGVLAISFVYQYVFGIKKSIDRATQKRLQTLLNQNTQFIVELIASQKTENQIRINKNLLVICGNEDEKKNTESLLGSMGFKQLQFAIVQQFEIIPKSDLVIFSNKNATLPEQIIIEYLENSHEEENFIFFGGRLNLDTQSNYADRINFANSKYTLYHQIINTLSFKEIFKLEKHLF